MNATLIVTRVYEEKRWFWLEKNKANSLSFSVLRKSTWGRLTAESLGLWSNSLNAKVDDEDYEWLSR